MFLPLLNDAGLSPEVCAGLLDVNPSRFAAWASGERDLPGYIVPELASVLGVTPDVLVRGNTTKAPAIWYKFRGEKLGDVDRELVILVRRLGFYVHQLNSVTGMTADKWQTIFSHTRSKLELHKGDSPSTQGEKAADVFRSQVDLGFPKLALNNRISGAGDVIRGMLRAIGVLIIEMPLPDSNMDGCSFYVGDAGVETPCLFINTYRQDWFRRNYILAHELAHAIFDIDGEAALIDYRGINADPSVKEARADAFAKALYTSSKVLTAITSQLGLQWDKLTTRDLALLVACAQVELKVSLRSAVEAGMLSSDRAQQYSKQSLKRELRAVTDHVLTPQEFFKLHPERAVWSGDLRTTTIPSRELRLPVPYIMHVLNSLNQGYISDGKAAEMMMMDYGVFIQRFGEFVEDVAA